MGLCNPKKIRSGKAWYQVVNDPIPEHLKPKFPWETGVKLNDRKTDTDPGSSGLR